jgi:HlyD family secretion protein
MKSPRKNRSRPVRKVLLWLLLAIGTGLIVINLLPKPVVVEVARVARGPLAVAVFEEGETRIRHRFTISSPVAGFLNRVELRAGEPIIAGQTVLATIQASVPGFLDPRATAEAEARLQAAKATTELRKAEVERARALLELAQKEAARAEALLQANAIARSEWETATSQVEVRTRDVTAAEFALQVAEFQVAQAQAAMLQTGMTPGEQAGAPVPIVAPIDGYVLQVFEESARPVTPGMPVMEVGDPRDLEAEIELLSSDAVAVKPGDPVSIEGWGGEQALRGRVTVVERGGFTKVSALGVEEQRVRVRVEFLDLPADAHLGDRYRVEARIVTWQNDDVLQVPTGALFRRGNQWMVFALKDGRAHAQAVTLGHQSPAAAEVTAGLKADDPVILYPPDSLSDGAKVATD